MSKSVNITRGWGLLEGFLARQRAAKANSVIPKTFREGRILDIGCGSYPYFLETTNFKDKYGLDPVINPEMIGIKGIKLSKSTIGTKKLSFTDSFFDVITMLAVFEHIEHDNLIPVIKEIHRVLKKNGILVITTPAPWADKLLHQMAKVSLISSEEIHEHKHNHPRLKIENILSQGGFTKNKIQSGFFEFHMNMWFTAKK
jgi:ubiquinone/menaquinone biosynthesis C-methylase UbiE